MRWLHCFKPRGPQDLQDSGSPRSWSTVRVSTESPGSWSWSRSLTLSLGVLKQHPTDAPWAGVGLQTTQSGLPWDRPLCKHTPHNQDRPSNGPPTSLRTLRERRDSEGPLPPDGHIWVPLPSAPLGGLMGPHWNALRRTGRDKGPRHWGSWGLGVLGSWSGSPGAVGLGGEPWT